MGMYVNPGKVGFEQITNGLYVDKSGLIDYVNSTIDTPDKLTCVSRPRRFGKSFAAKMLCAYYDKSCDSSDLFDSLEISKSAQYKKYINSLTVIYLDISRFLSLTDDLGKIVNKIQADVISDLRKTFQNCIDETTTSLSDACVQVTEHTNQRFFIIIDEWDALFREAKNEASIQEKYLKFLRGLFKGGMATDLTIAGAYMTGILPIKKYGTESALTDFREYTMVEPDMLASYVGFTEDEVQNLCEQSGMDFESMKQWYDGYCFSNIESVYSPNSVISAIRRKRYGNYWTQTETYESLKNYISLNLEGLKDDIIMMLGGQRKKVEILDFQNDIVNFKNKDNVLTLLVHLGYLAYDERLCEVYIPNLEVADSFRLAVKDSDWTEIANAIQQSEQLLQDTIVRKEDAVAKQLDRIHESTSSILQYNDENSLSCAITIAYYTARKNYKMVRELPAGKGFADVALIPKKQSDMPAIIIELKYDQEVDSAIAQIKEKRYDGVFSEDEDVLLVGISYDKKTKQHHCAIEKR